jgi:hypothetical protein
MDRIGAAATSARGSVSGLIRGADAIRVALLSLALAHVQLLPGVREWNLTPVELHHAVDVAPEVLLTHDDVRRKVRELLNADAELLLLAREVMNRLLGA